VSSLSGTGIIRATCRLALPFNPEIVLAIKTGAIRDFLDNSVIPCQTGERKTELKTADIARTAREYIMLISCTAKEKDN
jgi:hypothetical protein